MKRIPLFACLLLAVWPFLFFWQFAGGQQIFFFGDTAQFWYPTHVAYANALRAGHLPLWTPEIFGGFPLYAEMQIGALYPPQAAPFYGHRRYHAAGAYDCSAARPFWCGVQAELLRFTCHESYRESRVSGVGRGNR